MRILVLFLAVAVMLTPEASSQAPAAVSPSKTAPANGAPANGSSTAPPPYATPTGGRIAFVPANPGLKSIGTMSDLMLQVIFPTSNELFYVGRNEEKTQKDWNDLRNNILMMAEAANLLMADNRAKDKDRWMKDAWLLQDVGERAYKMVKTKDLEGLKGLNDELYEACQSCHEHYRPGYKRRL